MLKKLLLIGAVIAIVPMDRDNQQAVYDVASATVADLGGFCQRNPDVCSRSSILVDQFVAKAQFAGGLVVDLVQRTASSDSPLGDASEGDGYRRYDGGYATAPAPLAGEARLPAYTEHRMSESRVVGTLRGADMQPAWRGAAR